MLRSWPHLALVVIVHVATLKDGDTEPGYHPDANYMTHKISLEYYRRESRRVLEVFCELCPVVGMLPVASYRLN